MEWIIFFLFVAILAIWIGYDLTHSPDMSEHKENSRAQQEREDFTDV